MTLDFLFLEYISRPVDENLDIPEKLLFTVMFFSGKPLEKCLLAV